MQLPSAMRGSQRELSCAQYRSHPTTASLHSLPALTPAMTPKGNLPCAYPTRIQHPTHISKCAAAAQYVQHSTAHTPRDARRCTACSKHLATPAPLQTAATVTATANYHSTTAPSAHRPSPIEQSPQPAAAAAVVVVVGGRSAVSTLPVHLQHGTVPPPPCTLLHRQLRSDDALEDAAAAASCVAEIRITSATQCDAERVRHS